MKATETSTPTPTRVQQQGARSRQRILDATAALMADRGFAGTSISAICKRARLPASSVYWHFESKEGLLAAVIERGAMRWIDEIANAAAQPGTPRERLHHLLRQSAAAFDRRPAEYFRLLMLVTLDRTKRKGPWRATAERLRARMHALLEAALFDVFRGAGEAAARQIAGEGAAFALVLGDGVSFAAEQNPDGFDPGPILEQLETALIALGERRAAPRRRKQAVNILRVRTG